jgi:hypothetical protein
MRVQCTLIGCCYKLTSSGRNNRREQSLLVQQPSRVGKLLWSSVVLLLSGRCSSQQKDKRTYYWGELRELLDAGWVCSRNVASRRLLLLLLRWFW